MAELNAKLRQPRQKTEFLSKNCLHISKKELENILNQFSMKVETHLLKILQFETSKKQVAQKNRTNSEIPEEPKIQKKTFSGLLESVSPKKNLYSMCLLYL